MHHCIRSSTSTHVCVATQAQTTATRTGKTQRLSQPSCGGANNTAPQPLLLCRLGLGAACTCYQSLNACRVRWGPTALRCGPSEHLPLPPRVCTQAMLVLKMHAIPCMPWALQGHHSLARWPAWERQCAVCSLPVQAFCWAAIGVAMPMQMQMASNQQCW